MKASTVINVQSAVAKTGTWLTQEIRAEMEQLHRKMEQHAEEVRRSGRPGSSKELEKYDLSIRFPDGRRGYMSALPGQGGLASAFSALFETMDRREDVTVMLLLNFSSRVAGQDPYWMKFAEQAMARLRSVSLVLSEEMAKPQ